MRDRGTVTDFRLLQQHISRGEKNKVEDLVNSKDFSKEAYISMTEACNLFYACQSPLYVAASQGHLAIVSFLIERGLDYSHKQFETSPLIVASKAGHLEVVKALVELFDHNVNTVDRYDESALISAALSNNPFLVKYLVESGADVNHISPTGTALHAGIKSNNERIVRYILSQKFNNINSRDCNGHTALHISVLRLFDPMVDILLEHGADVNAFNRNEQSLFGLAIVNSSLTTIKQLHTHGADPEECSMGERPVYIAVRNGRVEIVHFLAVTLNVTLMSPDILDRDLNGLLYLAVRYHRWRTLILLLKVGYEISPGEFEMLKKRVRKLPDGYASSYIRNILSTPRSLADLCCFGIRRTLGTRLPLSIDGLPLPKHVLDFLKLTHVKHETLTDDDENSYS